MANIKSQIKRNRQSDALRVRNKSVRSRLKTLTKRYLETVDEGDGDAARDAYRAVSREYDKAASKGVIHRNTASNKKSRLAKRLGA
jgi:small subunit ribosomal protein S20